MTSASGEQQRDSLMAGVLAAGLVELTEELRHDSPDLPAAANMVLRDFKLAIRSFLAMELTVGLNSGPAVTLTLAAGPVAAQEVGSAFCLRLDGDSTTSMTLNCYAGQPAALHELATDLAMSLEVPPTAVDLRPGVPDHDLVPGLSGLNLLRVFYEDEGTRQAASTRPVR